MPVPKKLSARDIHKIAKVLADPRRFEILQKIACRGNAACSDLRDACPVTAATLSHHLKELESAGLIEAAKRGKFVDLTFQRDRWNAYLTALARL